MMKAYAKSYGIEYVILRFGSVYGYNPLAGGSNVIRTFLEMGLRGEPIVIWGPGRRRNQYTLLEDIVEGAIAALAASNETFNLISPEETTTGELGLHLRERYGFDVVFDHDKPEGPSMAYMSSRKAQKQLGWRPTELEKGIEATMVALQGAGP
jgi:nucleoside-diphosphate-sugar epimerase